MIFGRSLRPIANAHQVKRITGAVVTVRKFQETTKGCVLACGMVHQLFVSGVLSGAQ